MFDVTMLSVTGWDVHGPYVIRVTQTWRKSSPDWVEIVRHPSPFGDLDTESLLDQGWGNGVSHSDSFFFSVFTGGSSVPIPWENVIVKFMADINWSDDYKPHTERTVTVDGVFLEVSVHFIGAFVRIKKYCRIRIHDLSRLLDKYQAYWRGQDVQGTICTKPAVSGSKICLNKLFFALLSHRIVIILLLYLAFSWTTRYLKWNLKLPFLWYAFFTANIERDMLKPQ